MYTIKNDAFAKAAQLHSIDNFRSRYIEIDWDTGTSVIFPSFEIYAYEQHFFRLLSKSKKEQFRPRWEKRPDYASYDLYGSEVYWTLLLFVNNIFSIEDFQNLEFIFVPPMTLVHSIVDDRVRDMELEVINKQTIAPDNIFKMFARQKIAENHINTDMMIENIKKFNKEDIPKPMPTKVLKEYTDKVELTSTDLLKQYITLRDPVVNASTVTLYVNNFSIPQKYGYDYVLKEDDNNELKIISWLNEDCISGKSNMSYLLDGGDILHISYVCQVNI